MQNVEKHVIKPNEKQLFNYCDEITRASRRLYNNVQFAQHQSMLYGCGILSQGRLNLMFKEDSDYKLIKRKSCSTSFKTKF